MSRIAISVLLASMMALAIPGLALADHPGRHGRANVGHVPRPRGNQGHDVKSGRPAPGPGHRPGGHKMDRRTAGPDHRARRDLDHRRQRTDHRARRRPPRRTVSEIVEREVVYVPVANSPEPVLYPPDTGPSLRLGVSDSNGVSVSVGVGGGGFGFGVFVSD
ncbi:MAG: hypothetical protein LBL95_01955 [Deltaproteobacteria bacterium]|jgi:hypothetical protein|nr:hypothetical protein [Deltaproteobacteria bacterium]